jgi:hypothetical protein
LTRGISEIWLQVREESRQNLVTSAHFFDKNSLYE